MCRHGDTVPVVIDGRRHDIDRCIAPYVKALNNEGIRTSISCCGHGVKDGCIMTYYEGKYRLIIICPEGEKSLKRFKDEFQESLEYFDEKKKTKNKQAVPPEDKMIRKTETK